MIKLHNMPGAMPGLYPLNPYVKRMIQRMERLEAERDRQRRERIKRPRSPHR